MKQHDKDLLTPRCRVLLEKLVKKFPAFHGTRRFITALTSVRHLSLSWASPIQSIYPHPTSWRYILILPTHLRLGLPNGLLPSGFPTKTLYNPSPHPYAPHAQPMLTAWHQNSKSLPYYLSLHSLDLSLPFQPFRQLLLLPFFRPQILLLHFIQFLDASLWNPTYPVAAQLPCFHKVWVFCPKRPRICRSPPLGV